jgi:hypothetical protein
MQVRGAPQREERRGASGALSWPPCATTVAGGYRIVSTMTRIVVASLWLVGGGVSQVPVVAELPKQ